MKLCFLFWTTTKSFISFEGSLDSFKPIICSLPILIVLYSRLKYHRRDVYSSRPIENMKLATE